MRRLLCALSIVGLALAGEGRAQQLGAGVDPQAIAAVQTMLFDDVARRAFAGTQPGGAQANAYVEAFPAWATQEILEIMMMMLRESGDGATKHANAYGAGGVGGARASMSPAVNRRIDALVAKLKADPSFNNAPNLRRLQQQMPALPTRGS
jgi:hypothetical protein